MTTPPTLLTGATGFVGSAVARALLARGHRVRAFARPNSDRRNLQGLDIEVAEGDLSDPASLARAGYPQDAAEHLERALTLNPGNAPAHLALAGLYARDLGESDLARPHYEKVLTLDPKHPQAGAIRVWLVNNP